MNLKPHFHSLLVPLCGFIAWLASPQASAALNVTNGDFNDLTGLTDQGGGWYSGVPANWTTAAPSENGHQFSVLQVGSDNYANLDVLSSVSPNFAPLRQTIGTLAAAADITVTFKASSLNSLPYDLGSAIYNAAGDVLLASYNPPSPVNGNVSVTYTARGVAAGTEVYVGFWTSGSYAPGITDVTVSVAAAATTLTLESGTTLHLDAAAPARSAQSLVFEPGSKVSVTGPPSGDAVLLLAPTGTGTVSGTPVLDPAVTGYTLGVTGKRLWLYADGTPSLAVFNGDFNNLAGLTPQAVPWYAGVPADWTFTNPNNSTGFSMNDIGSGNLAANLSVLGIAFNGFNPLTQEVGTMDADGDVTVTFDISKPINSNPVAVGAALYHAETNDLLANVAIDDDPGPDSGLSFSVTALDVPAGTPVRIAFWSGLPPSAFPFLDNVALSVTPTGDTGFAAWQTANSTAGALDEDHDDDGVSNGIEYFIGGTTLPAANTTGFTALPGIVNTGGTLSIIWTMAASYDGNYGDDFRVETTETLSGAWATETEGVNVVVSGDDVTYTFPAGPVKKFARLVVTGP